VSRLEAQTLTICGKSHCGRRSTQVLVTFTHRRLLDRCSCRGGSYQAGWSHARISASSRPVSCASPTTALLPAACGPYCYNRARRDKTSLVSMLPGACSFRSGSAGTNLRSYRAASSRCPVSYWISFGATSAAMSGCTDKTVTILMCITPLTINGIALSGRFTFVLVRSQSQRVVQIWSLFRLCLECRD